MAVIFAGMKHSPRIISLISSATEILSGLGLSDQIVAVSHECDFPAEVTEKPRVTFSRVDSSQTSQAIDQQVRDVDESSGLYGIQRELICDLQPDLIVTQSQCDVCAVRFEDVAALVASQQALADTRLIDLNPHSLADVFDDIQRLGEATGTEGASGRWRARLQQRVANIAEVTSKLNTDERPRVACVEWTEPLMLAGNWTPELIELAGGRCPNPPGAHSEYQRWDEVLAYDPEVIVISPCGFDLPRTLLEAQDLLALPGWEETTAVKSGRVFAVDGNAFLNRSGPRLVDSVEILAHLLQPERFRQPLVPKGSAWCTFPV